ncbi:hypothetical protein AB0F42_26430 [Streptomyces buecherae]|uniref:hypothetical protein n=1 Tax=Streptomyces buecherae TaxID=2763006 RepID=UPI0033F2F718
MDQRDASTWILVVDGETFKVVDRPEEIGTYDFTWLSGPDPEYGFMVANHPPVAMSEAELKKEAQGFLEQVNPETGHIEE